ncbi:hypothetical protein AKG39_15555 [Acetobacterium bakii]|uniref:Uncharacterized protein n=1 Tax=Acetobacterium bakii TaxID=52689 RepID=A0A0L6TWU8_9FIRM|nr:hypothetical protein AKG39_15555 [Acetobacterium bakii]
MVSFYKIVIMIYKYYTNVYILSIYFLKKGAIIKLNQRSTQFFLNSMVSIIEKQTIRNSPIKLEKLPRLEVKI